ncbi:hypothetical protein SRRS_12600 [Sporomusa rhizae]
MASGFSVVLFLGINAYNIKAKAIFFRRVIAMKVTKVSPVYPVAKGFLHEKYIDPYSLRNKPDKSFKDKLDKELCQKSKIDIKT